MCITFDERDFKMYSVPKFYLMKGERGEEELSLHLNPNSQAGGEDVIGDNEVGNEVLDVYTYDE